MSSSRHAPLSTRPARNGEPQPAPPPTSSEPASAKRDLTSWWKQFSKRSAVKKDDEKGPQGEPEHRGIFGVPLIVSIPYANVAISLFNETGESYIYGYVPIVVAKCGVFLKEKATDVEGIFRLAGSEKRIKELKAQFDQPPRYGKGLDWTGYTVHDAANILRRYFNQLPEPIIPLQYYDKFRQPLRGHQAEAVGSIEGQAPSVGGFDPDNAVRVYQHLIKELPSLNRQLLLYILDLLAVFAAKSDVNKMTTSNLAAIFQPGILSHPQHDMSPQDYRLSQDVLIFLIDNQDHFLIGMEGTAVDERTVKHVQSGPSTPQVRTPTTPGRAASGLGRSASAASSAAAESIRRFGGVRRNVSTSSRQSRHSNAIPSPTTPVVGTPTGTGVGVHRSNTVPSKKSPAIQTGRFSNNKSSDPATPASEEATKLPVPATSLQQSTSSEPQPRPVETAEIQARSAGEEPDVPTPTQAIPSEHIDVVKAPQSTASEKVDVGPPVLDNLDQPRPEEQKDLRPTPFDIPGAYPFPSPAVLTPGSEDKAPFAPAATNAAQILAPPKPQHSDGKSPRLTPTHLRSEFVEGPIDSGPSLEPTPAVQRTFTQILARPSPAPEEKEKEKEKKELRKPNKLQKKPRLPSSSTHSSTHSLAEGPPSPLPPPPPIAGFHPSGSKEVLHSYNSDTVSSRNSGITLKPSMSPSASFRSHSTATEYSDADHVEEPPKEEKRSFWKSHRRGESKATPTASQTDLSGSIVGADKSMSSFGSSGGQGTRRSLQYDNQPAADVPYGSPPDKGHEKKGFSSWFRDLKQEHEAKKRAKSPPPSGFDPAAHHQHLGAPNSNESSGTRGRSMDVPRSTSGDSKDSSDVTPTGTSPQPLPLANPKVAPGASQEIPPVTSRTQKDEPSAPSTSAPATANPSSTPTSNPLKGGSPETQAPATAHPLSSPPPQPFPPGSIPAYAKNTPPPAPPKTQTFPPGTALSIAPGATSSTANSGNPTNTSEVPSGGSTSPTTNPNSGNLLDP